MKEEYAIVLDYLPHGYPLEKKMMPLVQAIGENDFVLLELVPRKGKELKTGEKVYIGSGKREEIYYIAGRLDKEKLTETAKEQIEEFISKITLEREEEFLSFFNTSEAINKKMHQIELLPGFGKKHMKEIIKQREDKKFESFKDMKDRIPNLPDPKKAIEKRIIKEITNVERHNLFKKSR